MQCGSAQALTLLSESASRHDAIKRMRAGLASGNSTGVASGGIHRIEPLIHPKVLLYSSHAAAELMCDDRCVGGGGVYPVDTAAKKKRGAEKGMTGDQRSRRAGGNAGGGK